MAPEALPNVDALLDGSGDSGSLWWAAAVFVVLVVVRAGRTCTVARFTSQDRGARRDYLRVPEGVPGLRRTSWVDLRPASLRRSAMRRRAGDPGPPFAHWCAEAAYRR